jgi:hypothetical protein
MELTITDTQIIVVQSFMTEYLFKSNITDIQVYGTDVIIHYAGRHDALRIDYANITLVNGAPPVNFATLLALLTTISLAELRVSITNGASVPGIPTGISGNGSVYAFNAGVLQEYGVFAFNSNGVVTLIHNSVNTVTTNTAAKLCIMQNSTLNGIEIRNNLGGTRDLLISLNY